MVAATLFADERQEREQQEVFSGNHLKDLGLPGLRLPRNISWIPHNDWSNDSIIFRHPDVFPDLGILDVCAEPDPARTQASFTS